MSQKDVIYSIQTLMSGCYIFDLKDSPSALLYHYKNKIISKPPTSIKALEYILLNGIIKENTIKKWVNKQNYNILDSPLKQVFETYTIQRNN